LTIARRLGLAADIIQQAQQQVGGFSDEINQVIAGLERQRRQQEQKHDAASQLLSQTEQLHQQLTAKAEALQARERELQLQQDQAIQLAIAQAKQEVAQVIRRLQQGNTTAQDAQQATAALNEIADRHLPNRQLPPKPKPGFQPNVGDRVRIPRLGQTAEVLSGADETGELSIRFGMMKMTVTLADIESLDGQKPDLPTKTGADKTQAKPGRSTKRDSELVNADPEPVALTIRTSKNTLDVRGSRVADAELDLDRALAETHENCLWIIHGHGTGRLRQGIHSFLQNHPRVREYQLAEQKEGGAGVTIVNLK
jgi:DNA mismatch repair protein MutS2